MKTAYSLHAKRKAIKNIKIIAKIQVITNIFYRFLVF